IDAHSREVLAQRWTNPETPIPVGSLVKPFTAMAYSGSFPKLECKGSANRCWRTAPHGTLDFVEALAQSCNAYFLHLAAMVDTPALANTTSSFGTPAPSANTPEARIGLGNGWRISPLALVKAYAELSTRAGDPRIDPILAGLERAAEIGTAQG